MLLLGQKCPFQNRTLQEIAKPILAVTDEIRIVAAGARISHYKGTGSIKEQVLTGEAKVMKED